MLALRRLKIRDEEKGNRRERSRREDWNFLDIGYWSLGGLQTGRYFGEILLCFYTRGILLLL